MPVIERVRTELVVIHSYAHDPWDAHATCEWWPRDCVAFTTFGSWEVRARGGRGEVGTGAVLAGRAGDEYDCRHERGMDDRALSITYRAAADLGPALLLPLTPGLRGLRRALAAELRSAEPDVDDLCLALLDATRQPPDRAPVHGMATRTIVERIRALAETRFADPELDLVAEAAAGGMSRTRLVHAFRDLVGVTPHRYVIELRTAYAARLLRRSRAPVTEICFASGFGSIARFQTAFREAFGTTPTAYRAALSEQRRP